MGAINRAVTRAARRLTEDPTPDLHYLIADVPPEIVTLESGDFRPGRLRYAAPGPYSERDFQRTLDWMLRWDLIGNDATYQTVVDNRAVAV